MSVVQTVLKLKDNMSKPLFQVSKNVGKVDKSMKRSANQLNKWGKTATKNIDKVVKKSAKLVTGLGVTMAGLGAKMGFSEAMNTEGYRVQIETAVKDTEKASKLMVKAVKYANKTPFETGEVVEATAMMEAYGNSSERWLSDVADMAGATSRTIMEATEAMSDSVRGEFDTIKKFGILKEQLVAAAAEKYGDDVVFNAKGQVMDRLKLEDILQAEMQKKFKGGADALSKTLKGRLSTVTGLTKETLKAIVGMQLDGTIKQGSMYQKLKDQIETVANTLMKWQEDGTIEEIAKSVTSAVNKIMTVFKNLFNFIIKYQTIIKTVMIFAGTVYTLTKAVAGLNIAMAAFKSIMTLVNATLIMNPTNLIIVGVAALVAGVYLLYKNWDTLVAAFKTGFEWIKNLVIEAGKFYLEITGLGDAIKLLINIFDRLKNVASGAFNKVKSIFGLGDKSKDIDVNLNKTENTGLTEYADGGIASKPSIFGEAGPEIAIPLNNKPRSKALLNQANNIMGSGGSGGTTISVTITGDVYGFEDFKERVAEAFVKVMDHNGANVVGGV